MKKLVLVIFLFGMGCGETPSQLAVRGGLLAGESFKSVVGLQISADPSSVFCSGVMISHYEVLAAGHCLLGVDHVYLGNHVSTQILFSDENFEQINQAGVGPWRSKPVLLDLEYDIAKIVFPPQTAQRLGIDRIYPLATTDQLIGHEVVVVGYGAHEDDSPDRGTRRFGVNQIDWVNFQALEVSGPVQVHNGQKATAMGGDSGGALLLHHGDNRFSLAGIVVRGDFDGELHHTGFSNIQSNTAKRLIEY